MKSIGIKVDEKFDSLKIYGNPNLQIKKSLIKNFLKDHRVFMMSCMAALTWEEISKYMIKTLLILPFLIL